MINGALIAVVWFFAKHVLVLAAILVVSAGAGTLVLRERGSMALRAALGLALWAHALFLLALLGQLNIISVSFLTLVSLFGVPMWRGVPPALLLLAIPAFLMALLPPIAFDETLYHLPFIEAIADSGRLRFLADLRYPVFPQLQELLCVPVYLIAGDTATHLVSLAELLIAIALVHEWGGGVAAALFAGGPIVVQLATIGYTETALTLFVVAGFLCLDRERFALAGLFLGSACGVKYLGGFFAVAALLVILSRGRLKPALHFAISCAAAALPMTVWIVAHTGDPAFPFLTDSIWAHPHAAPDFARLARVPFDVTFARERVNQQPPFTPLFIPMLVAMLIAARRDVRARGIAIMTIAYLAIFAFLPQDSRYLVPLLPLIAVAAATVLPSKRWMIAIAIAPGILYMFYALAVRGLPPATPASREAMLTRRIPEYTALQRAGDATVYVCRAEELRYHARGRLLGDWFGPYGYARILPDASNLRRIGAEYLLISKRRCGMKPDPNALQLVYEDAHAQLWRVR